MRERGEGTGSYLGPDEGSVLLGHPHVADLAGTARGQNRPAREQHHGGARFPRDLALGEAKVRAQFRGARLGQIHLTHETNFVPPLRGVAEPSLVAVPRERPRIQHLGHGEWVGVLK